ncbi:hypothetical protein AQ619_12375 [Caulobacter henricii]|uniref:Uncharacterized protein n=1 Tax=Caulobacter henricii TaxID=69395 RepID=A0A0N7JHQ8_9CAUL|nr:hypothetical protein AQ619_12375 [Caulobacter henricii]
MVLSPLWVVWETDETRNKKAPLLSEAGLFEDLAIRRLRFGYLARRCPVRTGTVLIWFHIIMVAAHDIAATAAKPVTSAILLAKSETMWTQLFLACQQDVA